MVINLIDWTHIVERFWRITSKQSKGLKKLKVTNFQSLWIRNDNMTLRKLHIISPSINYLILKSSYYVKFWIFHYYRNALNLKIIYCHLNCYIEMFMIVIIKMSLFCSLKVRKKDVGLSSYRIYNKKDHRFENLSQEEYEAFINLSNNKNIIIRKADKGNTVVIIDWTNYLKEMEKYCQIPTNFLKLHSILNIKWIKNFDIFCILSNLWKTA